MGKVRSDTFKCPLCNRKPAKLVDMAASQKEELQAKKVGQKRTMAKRKMSLSEDDDDEDEDEEASVVEMIKPR